MELFVYWERVADNWHPKPKGSLGPQYPEVLDFLSQWALGSNPTWKMGCLCSDLNK